MSAYHLLCSDRLRMNVWHQPLQIKRQFLLKASYQSSEELLADATAGGPATHYVDHMLQLRHRSDNRKSLDALRTAMLPGTEPPHWLRRFKSAAWLIYVTEKELVQAGSAPRPECNVEAGPGLRQLLAGSGLTLQRRPLRNKLRSRAAKREAAFVGSKVCVLWMDNFNRQRYSKNPAATRNQSINGTAMAKLPIDVGQAGWQGQPNVKAMYNKVDQVASALVSSHRAFVNSVRTLELENLQYEDVRVPCDRRRRGVSAASWLPHDVREGNIGSLEGLAVGLKYASQLQLTTGRVQPVMSDVNIFYRSLKLMYGTTFAHDNVRGAMENVPFVFGVWHAYAHCVKRCYAAFKSFWVCMEYKELLSSSDATQVYSYPKLVTLEHMIVAMFLARDDVKVRLNQTLQSNNADVLVDLGKWQLVMLHRLLFDFVPALMHIGISVRRCYWEGRQPNTGNWAKQVISDCMAFLVAVDNRGSSEYIRSLGLTLLYWSPFHSAMPAVAFVEEALEASLSRLARMLTGSYHADSVSDIGSMYCSLGTANTKRHDLSKPGVSRVYTKQLAIRLSKLLDYIVSGTMPYVPAGKANKMPGSRLWPTGKLKAVPARVLVVEHDQEYYADILVHALALMTKMGSATLWDQQVVEQLCAGVRQLPADKVQARLAMQAFLDQKRLASRTKATTRRGKKRARPSLVSDPVAEPTGVCSLPSYRHSQFPIPGPIVWTAVDAARYGAPSDARRPRPPPDDPVTDPEGVSDDEAVTDDSRSTANSEDTARTSPSRACSSGANSDEEDFQGPDSDDSGYEPV